MNKESVSVLSSYVLFSNTLILIFLLSTFSISIQSEEYRVVSSSSTPRRSLLFASCNQIDENFSEPQKKTIEVALSNEEYLSIMKDDLPELSDDKVIRIASDFSKELYSQSNTKSGSTPTFKIVKKNKLKSSTGEETNIIFYQ